MVTLKARCFIIEVSLESCALGEEVGRFLPRWLSSVPVMQSSVDHIFELDVNPQVFQLQLYTCHSFVSVRQPHEYVDSAARQFDDYHPLLQPQCRISSAPERPRNYTPVSIHLTEIAKGVSWQ